MAKRSNHPAVIEPDTHFDDQVEEDARPKSKRQRRQPMVVSRDAAAMTLLSFRTGAVFRSQTTSRAVSSAVERARRRPLEDAAGEPGAPDVVPEHHHSSGASSITDDEDDKTMTPPKSSIQQEVDPPVPESIISSSYHHPLLPPPPQATLLSLYEQVYKNMYYNNNKSNKHQQQVIIPLPAGRPLPPAPALPSFPVFGNNNNIKHNGNKLSSSKKSRSS